MATARPGWSRRAQYGLFFSFLAVIAGIVVGLILLVLSLVAPKSYETVRGAALDVTAPVTGALSEVTATVEGLFTGAGDYWNAANQNAELKRERWALMQRMVEARAIVQENKQLKAALQLRERTRDAVAAGRIVGSSFNSPRRFAIFLVIKEFPALLFAQVGKRQLTLGLLAPHHALGQPDFLLHRQEIGHADFLEIEAD